ncbi:hypothetical protein BCY76_001955 [Nesterenkonia sp. PF2B19]|nr:hypothetical protein BCY76_001955 [Nesterenkonia sp. PF2B19]
MTQRQIRLNVVGVRIEVPSHQPVVMLRGAEPGMEDLHVAIMVGTSEATAISMGMDGQTPPRPMTHDLLVDALTGLADGVESIEIGLLDSSTYFGTIRLRRGQVLDSRASDAIAVAVRTAARITMAESTLRAVAVTPPYRTRRRGLRFLRPGSAARRTPGRQSRGGRCGGAGTDLRRRDQRVPEVPRRRGAGGLRQVHLLSGKLVDSCGRAPRRGVECGRRPEVSSSSGFCAPASHRATRRHGRSGCL